MPTISYYESRNKRQTDWFLVGLFLTLVAVGYAAIYSAKFSSDIPSLLENFGAFIKTSPGKQLIWVSISITVAGIIQLVDRKIINLLAPVIYAFVMLLLVFVMFKGHTVGGGSSWINLGPIRLQPSEFAKFSTALMVAWYLSQVKVSIKSLQGKIITGIIILIPLALTVLQNDTGTALVFTSFIFVLYREGLSNWYMISIASAIILGVLTLLLQNYWIILLGISLIGLIIAILNYAPSWKETLFVLAIGSSMILGAEFLSPFVFTGIIVALIFICLFAYLYSRYSFYMLMCLMFFATAYTQAVGIAYNYVLKPHQQARIDVLLGKKIDTKGAGYQVNQSMIAIGSGGETGKGYLNGNLTKGNFVPDQSTDFIFCTVGEEFGFVGTTLIVLLYLMLMLRIVYVAERQPAKFTRVYAYAAAGIIFIHFWINIGMTIGLMPVIGIPLPGMSYGGSSLLGFTLLIATLVRLDADRGNYSR